jgi:hypothetical protein
VPTVYLVHWNEAEAAAHAAALTKAGYAVTTHWSQDSSPKLPDPLPDAVVISLDRLPSHGRAIAEWVWEAKKRQHIPIVFAGGKPDKVAAVREKFPTAAFCPTEDVAATLARLVPAK